MVRKKLNLSILFEEYGRAAHMAQLLEYNLVSIWILDSINQGTTLTKEDLLKFQATWGKKTLGGLLRPLQSSPLIPEDMKVFLENIRKDRNKLIHTFFILDDINFESTEAISAALDELNRIKQNLDNGRKFFHSVLESYCRDFGIDTDKINSEIKAKILDMIDEDN
jgi:hypothetical protein